MKINESFHYDNFISLFSPTDLKFCDKIIKYFEERQELHLSGSTSTGINFYSKKTTEIAITPNHIEKDFIFIEEYLSFVMHCYLNYTQKWPILIDFATNVEIGVFNIQKYNTGDHFNKLHTERMNYGTLQRVLVWMTYLNDVEEGGHTQFDYLNTKIRPTKGLTLLWPSDWTHAHRGCSVLKGNKYIITGWIDLSFSTN